MKCPLLVNTRDQELGLRIAFFGECLKEECAWWSKSMAACCIPVLAANFIGLNETLLHLVDKMPHEGQSRK